MPALARWGESWGIRGMTDLAVFPLAALLLTIFSFVLTPVNNTITRTIEYEADMYGINASQQPDGEAEVDLMLGEYRKLDPGPIEEFVFFDHPSGRTRITAAMRWKAEHLPGAPLGPDELGGDSIETGAASIGCALPRFCSARLFHPFRASPASDPGLTPWATSLAPLSRSLEAVKRPGKTLLAASPRITDSVKTGYRRGFWRISTGIRQASCQAVRLSVNLSP